MMAKTMSLKSNIALLALVTLLLAVNVESTASANEGAKKSDEVETSTESPIADMAAIIDTDIKTSTERPPTNEGATKKHEEPPSSQRHTVGDFIIHPLVAFKPRTPQDDMPIEAGKQAGSTTPAPASASPWQIFTFNAGQTLGSSVSSLTNWINDRIQFPGLVESPIRESTTTSSSTSTTTTQRPDIVVRVQHKPSTRRPLIAINNDNRPNRPIFDSIEEDDDEDEYEEDDSFVPNRRRGGGQNNHINEDVTDEDSYENNHNNGYDHDEDNSAQSGEEEDDDHDTENYSQRPNNRRRPIRRYNNGNGANPVRRRQPNWQRPRQPPRFSNVQHDDDYVDNNAFYYGSQPSTKRSSQQAGFIRRGQQHLINQIRQLTRGQSPADISELMSNSLSADQVTPNNRRQQATLFVNRNGQAVYMAPELALVASPQNFVQPVNIKVPISTSTFPQPPLTTPLTRRGEATQYITIPWSQLGISPPNNLVAIAEGVQTQPLILNIPQSALKTMQSTAIRATKKQPTKQLITADSVPLLAEASLMNIFKPPEIPPSRTTSTATTNSKQLVNTGGRKPVSTTHVKMTPMLQQRIRPNTIVEKAPMLDTLKETVVDTDADSARGDNQGAPSDTEREYIVVGDDNEPGLNRKVEPVLGEARYVRYKNRARTPGLFEVLQPGRIVWRNGARSLDNAENIQVINKNMDRVSNEEKAPNNDDEKQIPVQVIDELEPKQVNDLQENSSQKESKTETTENTTDSSMIKPSDPLPKEMPQISS